MAKIPSYTGTDSESPGRPEIEHFGNCPFCGTLVDMRDLAQVFAHMHDQQPLDLTGRPDTTWLCNRGGQRFSFVSGPQRPRLSSPLSGILSCAFAGNVCGGF